MIGFAGLADYPKLLSVLADEEQGAATRSSRLGLALGLGPGPRAPSRWRSALALLALCWREGRRGLDERSLALALAAALALSPIVWLHYFVLLLVPIALARRTFGAIWLIPALFWITPVRGELRRSTGASRSASRSSALALAAAARRCDVRAAYDPAR